MKKILIATINIYQILISPFLKQLIGMSSMCRFTPTCSEYAKLSVEKHGIIKGLKLGLVRLLHCQPFTKNLSGLRHLDDMQGAREERSEPYSRSTVRSTEARNEADRQMIRPKYANL